MKNLEPQVITNARMLVKLDTGDYRFAKNYLATGNYRNIGQALNECKRTKRQLRASCKRLVALLVLRRQQRGQDLGYLANLL